MAESSVPRENNLRISAFDVVEVDHKLEVVDRRSTTFRSEHEFLLVAQIPSRFFVREYFWTGSGSEKELVPDLVTNVDVWGFPDQRIHGPLVIEGNTRILVVDLGRTILPGETVRVHFQHRMKDLNGTFKPLFVARPSKTVRNRISIRLILPSWSGLRVMYHRFTHDTEKVVDATVLPPVSDANGKLTFHRELVNPSDQNMGHRLAWSHDETVG